MTGNVQQAYDVLRAAEAKETEAREALWAVLRLGESPAPA
jgi:hypothetical protein